VADFFALSYDAYGNPLSVGTFGHTYKDDGTYTVTFTVSNPGGTGFTSQETVAVSDPVLTANVREDLYLGEDADFPQPGIDPTAVLSPIAAFQDSNFRLGPDDFSALVDWGDGTTSAGTISGQDGSFSVNSNHSYSRPGIYDVKVLVASSDGGSTAADGDCVVEPDISRPQVITVSGVDGDAEPGADFSGTVAKISDSDLADQASDLTAQIYWSDDGTTTAGVVTGSDGTFTVTGNHIISQEYDILDQITVTIIKNNNLTTSSRSSIYVSTPGQAGSTPTVGDATNLVLNDVSPSGTTVEATQDEEYDGPVGYFQVSRVGASAGDFEADIYWGDGTYSQGTVSVIEGATYQVEGAHTYAERGAYQIFVLVVDSVVSNINQHFYSVYGTAFYNFTHHYNSEDYNNVPTDYIPYLNYVPKGLSPSFFNSFGINTGAVVQGQQPSLSAGVNHDADVGEELTDVVLATGTTTDGNARDSFTAMVAWGDGTSSVQLVESENGTFEVTGDHTYLAPGNYQAVVTLYDGILQLHAVNLIDVASNASSPPLLEAGALDVEATAGESLDAPVATLTDNNPAHIGGLHLVTIDWGDLSSSVGTLEAGSQAGQYQVYGIHTYAEPGRYVIRVVIQDQDDTADVTGIATVAAAQIHAAGTIIQANQLYPWDYDVAAADRASDVVVAEFDDADPDDFASSFSASIALGNGSPAISGTVFGGDGHFYVALPTTGLTYYFPFDPESTVTVTVIDAGTEVAQVNSYVVNGDAVSVAGGTAFISNAAMLPTGLNGYQLFFNVTGWGGGSPDSAYAQLYNIPNTYTIQYTEYKIPFGSPATPLGSGSVEIVATERPLTLIENGDNDSVTNGVVGNELDQAPIFSFISSVPDETASDFTVSIAWGDGHSSTGWVEATPQGTFDVYGDHTYDSGGTFSITALVVDQYGTSLSGGRAAQIAIDAQGVSFGAYARVDTADVVLATIADPDGVDAAQPTAVVDWGDGSLSVASIRYDSTDNEFEVLGDHVYYQPGTYDADIEITENGDRTDVGALATIESGWSLGGGPLTNSPTATELIDLGQAQVAPNTGGLRIDQPLDFDQSPGTSVGGDPVLTYNSDTVDVRPIIQAQLASSAGEPVPDEIKVQLTFNGVAQGWTTYDTTGHQPGDDYLITAQVDQAVAQSGLYPWSLQVVMDFGGAEPEFQVGISGTARVVVNDSPAPDPDSPFASIDFLGAGWGITGIERLVLNADSNGDILWANGAGGSAAFTRNTDGSFTSPPDEFGTLVENDDSTFTYTAPDQTRYEFNTLGLLKSVVAPDGLETTYEYTEQGELERVTAPDGGITTFDYDSDTLLLKSITEPGGLEWQFEHDGDGNLTRITDPDDNERALNYDSHGHLTEQTWGPLNLDGSGEIDETYTYDSSGLLTEIDDSGDSTYQVTPAAAQGLDAEELLDADEGVATIEDGLGNTTTYVLDTDGRLLKETSPDGTSQTWQLDAHGQVVNYTDNLDNVTKYTYDYSKDGDGDLTSVKNPDGTIDSFQYDSKFHEVTLEETPGPDGTEEATTDTYDPDTGELLTSTDALGNATSYSWSGGLLTSTTDGRGNTTTYDYDAHKRLVEEIDPLGASTTMAYDANGNLISVTDPLGQTTTYAYDADSRQISVTDPLGGVTTTVYDAVGNVVSVTDPLGNATTYDYDDEDRLVGETDPLGGVTTTAYDADGNVTSVTDPLGNATTYEYDADGRQISQTDPLGGVTMTTYDADGNVTATTDPLGNMTTYEYDADGRQTSQTDPLGGVTTTTYDAAGNAVSVVDPLGNTTIFEYDADNRRISETDPLGGTTITEYDPNGNVISVTDPLGNTTTYAYDAGNRQTGQTDPLGGTTTTEYDANGNVIGVTDPLGNSTARAYDANGNMTGETDPLGHTTTYAYDGDNQLVGETDPLGGTTVTAYDANGNVISKSDPLGHTTAFAYDADNQQIRETDPLGYTTITAYDANGNVVSETDPLGGTTITAYDANGNVLSVTDPDGNVTSYAYDRNGNVVTQTDPGGGQTTKVYDADSDVTNETNPNGDVTTSTYDADGNLLTQSWTGPGGQGDTTRFTYDANGNFLSASDDGGAVAYTFTYDANGNLATQGGPWGLSLSFGHDANGNRTSTSDSLGGTTSSTYDGNGNLTSLHFADGTSDLGVAWTYDGGGNPITVTRTDHGQAAGSSQNSYDADGNVTGINHYGPSGATLAAFIYSYDLVDRLTSKTDNGTTTNYSYDSEGQLISAGSQSYSYDANGNPTDGTTVGTGNEIASDGDWSYTYDAAGNRVTASNSSTGGSWTYGYNAQNQMISAVATDGSGATIENVSYEYDPFGNRVLETVTDGSGNVTTTRYAYDAQSQTLWATFDGTGNLETRYITAPGSDQVVAQIGTDGATAWLLTDHLGSTRLVVNSEGSILDQLSYGSFGSVTESEPNFAELIEYTGWQYDVVTGLDYTPARWYDPVTSTWINEDPSGFAAGDTNLDRYVGNSPTNETDPSGLQGTVVPTDPNGRWNPFRAPQAPPASLPSYISPDSPTGKEVLRIQQGDYTEGEQRLLKRAEATVGLAGAATEIAAGIVFIPATSGGSLIVTGLGIDSGIASGRQIWTGEVTATGVTQLGTAMAANAGYNPETASLIGNGVDLSLHLGAGFIAVAVAERSALRLASIPVFAESGAASVSRLNTSQAPDVNVAQMLHELGLEPISGGAPVGVSRAVVAPRAYSVAFETQLARAEFGLRRAVHFQIANEALQAERAANPALADLVSAPIRWGRPPADWVWQHATIEQGTGRAGVLQLVPKAQHTSGSPYWSLFHPLPGGAGGYVEWAIPAGAPPN
jgi:RHS repeat-associated protein